MSHNVEEMHRWMIDEAFMYELKEPSIATVELYYELRELRSMPDTRAFCFLGEESDIQVLIRPVGTRERSAALFRHKAGSPLHYSVTTRGPSTVTNLKKCKPRVSGSIPTKRARDIFDEVHEFLMGVRTLTKVGSFDTQRNYFPI